MLRLKVLELTAKSKTQMQDAYSKLRKQYNLLYGIDHLEKQNESLQRIEKSLIESVNQRREIQKSLSEIQDKIRETRNLLDKSDKRSDNYLTLVTNEHRLIKSEYDLVSSLRLEEEKERNLLNLFSENIRKTHQLDLVIQSRQKLLAFVYSVCAGIIGFWTHAYVNRNKLEFFSREIDRIKGQHEVTLLELNTMNEKLEQILEMEIQIKEAAISKAPPVQQPVPQTSQSNSWSYSSIISYPFVPFVKLYRYLLS